MIGLISTLIDLVVTIWAIAFVCVFYWIYSLIQLKQLLSDPSISTVANLFVAAGTIALALVAYKQMTENRLIENVKHHSNDIKELLHQWNNSIPEITIAESVDSNSIFELAPLYNVENHPLFTDIKNHLPDEHRAFFDKWNRFKEQISEYNTKKQQLFRNFVEHVDEECNTRFPANSIYARAVSLVKEEMFLPMLWYYSGAGEEVIYESIQKSITLGWGDRERMEKNHTNVSKWYSGKFNNEIKEVMEIERRLIKDRINIKKMIIDLTFYPSFPNPKCKHIQGAFK